MTTKIMPMSSTVSPEFAAFFGHDTERWKPHISSLNPRDFFRSMLQPVIRGPRARDWSVKEYEHFYEVTHERSKIGGISCFKLYPGKLRSEDALILYVHGGGFVLGTGIDGIPGGICAAGACGLNTVCVDYRLAPEHVYPAALQDCLQIYQALLKIHDASKIVLYGTSSGAALCLSLGLYCRDHGIALPGLILAGSPWADLTKTGDSYYTHAFVDNEVVDYSGWLSSAALAYAGDHDLKDPYISPVYGDFTGFCPVVLFSGTRDLFLSCSARLQAKLLQAHVPNNLVLYEGQSHAQYSSNPDIPEHGVHCANLAIYVDRYLGLNGTPAEQ
ncbi:MAG: alpha/beta hydrolase [Proteobacteria bacterium]|uniref:Alpha/beta hydrolase n=1 Tax=Candidatus Avisuccinivibrio stercorigallinarum TaxID=2840704 RepID=A0A9D9DC73_9GAMM|nr:alpha/beta hydrolase [Candidatus Avisuccinivibrio stercorigallinarum]